jgi:hypothetical protein
MRFVYHVTYVHNLCSLKLKHKSVDFLYLECRHTRRIECRPVWLITMLKRNKVHPRTDQEDPDGSSDKALIFL